MESVRQAPSQFYPLQLSGLGKPETLSEPPFPCGKMRVRISYRLAVRIK